MLLKINSYLPSILSSTIRFLSTYCEIHPSNSTTQLDINEIIEIQSVPSLVTTKCRKKLVIYKSTIHAMFLPQSSGGNQQTCHLAIRQSLFLGCHRNVSLEEHFEGHWDRRRDLTSLQQHYTPSLPSSEERRFSWKRTFNFAGFVILKDIFYYELLSCG